MSWQASAANYSKRLTSNTVITTLECFDKKGESTATRGAKHGDDRLGGEVVIVFCVRHFDGEWSCGILGMYSERKCRCVEFERNG